MANIQVILKTHMKKLGRIADEVSVAAGFARNYLLPQGMAVPATAANRAEVAEMRAELEAKAAKDLATAEVRAKALSAVVLKLAVHAMPEGKLYGSVGPEEIVHAYKEAGHDVLHREVVMLDGPVKKVGESQIILRLHAELDLPVNLVVESDAVIEDDAPVSPHAADDADLADSTDAGDDSANG